MKSHVSTGSRRVPLIDSTPYLADWLNNHPQKDSPHKFCSRCGGVLDIQTGVTMEDKIREKDE